MKRITLTEYRDGVENLLAQSIPDQIKKLIAGFPPDLAESMQRDFEEAAINDPEWLQGAKRHVAIINAMTDHERESPNILDSRRVRRIAAGSGVTRPEVIDLLNTFKSMNDLSFDPMSCVTLRDRFRGQGEF